MEAESSVMWSYRLSARSLWKNRLRAMGRMPEKILQSRELGGGSPQLSEQ